MLRSSPDENLPSIKHYVASVSHWMDYWVELKKKGIPVIGMSLMGPNRHDHWSQLTEPFSASVLTLAACIEATKSHGWNEANRWSLERQLKIDVLPEKMYPRPMPIVNATFPGSQVWMQLQAFENRRIEALRLLSDDKVKDYVTPWHIKKCKQYKPVLGEIKMRATAQLDRLQDDIAELQRQMLKTSSSVTVKEWLREYASPVKIQLEHLLQKIDALWSCDRKKV